MNSLSTLNLIGSRNKHPNIQSHKATKIHTLTPLTYELFFQNSSKMDLQRDGNWFYRKKTTSLITNSLQTTKLAPFKCEISYECRTPILVEESSQIRQL